MVSDAVVVEMGPIGQGSSAETDSEFLKSFDRVKASLKKIRANTEAISLLNNRANVEVKESEQREIMAQLDELMQSTKQEATKTKDILSALEAESKDYAAKNKGSTNTQIRSNLLATHTRHFNNAMRDFQTASESFRDSLKQRIARQARIVKQDITEEEVENIIASDNPGQFIKEYMGLSDVLVDAVAELEERHEKMRKIEQEVKGILELFQDLATLVELQQEHLDNIEQNVSRTKEYTRKAEKELIYAREKQISARKWGCCLLFLLLIVVVILIVVFGVL